MHNDGEKTKEQEYNIKQYRLLCDPKTKKEKQNQHLTATIAPPPAKLKQKQTHETMNPQEEEKN